MMRFFRPYQIRQNVLLPLSKYFSSVTRGSENIVRSTSFIQPTLYPSEIAPLRGKVVFVKNLPRSTTSSELRYAFGLHGRIDQIDNNELTAYVHYATEAGARAAITNLDGCPSRFVIARAPGSERDQQGKLLSVSLSLPPKPKQLLEKHLLEKRKGAFFSKTSKFRFKRVADRKAMKKTLESLLYPSNHLALNAKDFSQIIQHTIRMKLYDTAYLMLLAAQLKKKDRGGQLGLGIYTHGDTVWSGSGTFADAYAATRTDENYSTLQSKPKILSFMEKNVVLTAYHYDSTLWCCHESLEEMISLKQNRMNREKVLQTANNIFELMKSNGILPTGTTYQLMISISTKMGERSPAMRMVKNWQKQVMEGFIDPGKFFIFFF